MEIEHYMWGYQPHFRVGHEVHSKSIFGSLDSRFDPEVFIVGILVEKRSDRYPACVEPENDFWIPSESFNNAISSARKLIPTYKESALRHSHPRVQEEHDESLFRRGIRDAVLETIRKCKTKPADKKYFCSFPAMRDGFLVMLVLGLQTHVIKSHPSMSIDRVDIHELRSRRVAVSLIDAVILEYLDDAAGELLKPNPGAGGPQGKSSDDLLRSAGNRLMNDLAYKADKNLDQIGYWGSLFDTLNRIASLKYEQGAPRGKIALSQQEHPCLFKEASFKRPINMRNGKGVRKLLELTSENLMLHINSKYAFGLVRVARPSTKEDLYEIKISDQHVWELIYSGKVLMHTISGVPGLPSPPFNESKLRLDLRRIFKRITAKNIDLLVGLVQEATDERHGTLLVISEDAAKEAARLANQATLLVPQKIEPALLRHLTPIDGAVLLSPDGTCFAIGVILDGIATKNGNSSRGARYNSAIRYVEMQKACLAVIVSEDGGIDLVPNLLPAIDPKTIQRSLSQLKTLLQSRKISRRLYAKEVEWLDAHRFYLSKKNCKVANRLIASIDRRIYKEDADRIRIIRHKYKVDPNLRPSVHYARKP